MQKTWVRFLGQEDPLEKEMATHSSILAWRIPMDRGSWQATVHGVRRVGHNLLTKLLGEAHQLKLPTLTRHHSIHLHELFYDRRS